AVCALYPSPPATRLKIVHAITAFSAAAFLGTSATTEWFSRTRVSTHPTRELESDTDSPMWLLFVLSAVMSYFSFLGFIFSLLIVGIGLSLFFRYLSRSFVLAREAAPLRFSIGALISGFALLVMSIVLPAKSL